MLDIKFIKDNRDKVIGRLNERFQKDFTQDIDNVTALYNERNALIYAVEQMKAKQNTVTKEIPKLKKEGRDTAALFAEMKELSDIIKADDEKIKEIDAKIEEILLYIPNIPHPSVVVGHDEKENEVVRVTGEPVKFGFEPAAHWDIGERLGILDPERAAKVTGARFHFYIGDGARLERAVISYFLDVHRKSGYKEIFPPFIANAASMRGTGQLPKFAEDMFRLEGTDYYLIPTAEVPVTNYRSNEILTLADGAPVKYCAYSACFRAEAGSAGRDTRGLIRQHQFNKVELVKFTTPETSYDELEALTLDAEKVLQGLGFAYRVSLLSTGDMTFCSAKTYDIEVYMPSYGRYVEISSCSNFEDYQARRSGIRFKRDAKEKAQYAHTLNGSGVAVGRTVACILETYQNADGSVTVPEALRPYMGGQERIEAQ